jgi:hypothetical protein
LFRAPADGFMVLERFMRVLLPTGSSPSPGNAA